ncbi:MAG: HAMP domain-containing protein, partial [Bacteroidales bacterium]
MGKTSGITVKGRIYGGFSAVLLLLLLVSGLGIWGLSSISGNVGNYAALTNNTSRLQLIDRNVVGLRRNAYIYAQENTEQSLNRFRELQRTLQADLPAAVAAATSGERKASLERMQQLFELYSANFDKVVTLKNRATKGEREVLVPTGIEITRSLTALMDNTLAAKDWETAAYAGRVQDAVSATRLVAAKFLADPDTAKVETFRQQYAIASKTMKLLLDSEKDGDHRRIIESIAALLPTYERAFLDVAEASLEVDRLVTKENAALAAEFGDLAQKTRVSALGALDDIRAATESLIDKQQGSAAIVAAIALAIGIAAAYLISRSILVPVNNMTAAMGDLAGGQLDVTVPALDRTDEIGEMAKAVQVFKQNAIDK